jgi:hypothetical protein
MRTAFWKKLDAIRADSHLIRVIRAMALAATVPLQLDAQGNFGNLAAGPYNRLVIRGAMVIPGHGGPPAGPYDIVIERNVITQMIPSPPSGAVIRSAPRVTVSSMAPASTSCPG